VNTLSLPSPAPAHIILYGGSFDPPHLGHARLPALARDAWARDRGIDPASTLLLYIPAARSPHKAERPQATDSQRLEMLSLILAEDASTAPRPQVWPVELTRAMLDPTRPSFTIDTAAALREKLDAQGLAATELSLLIGADQLVALHRWHRARELVALAPPIVMLRPPNIEPDQLGDALLTTGAWSPADVAHLLASLVIIPTMPVSSTAARAAAEAGHVTGDWSALTQLVGPAVARYISEQGLYRQ
jgi:nicotinate-nucleotide adenylyltransferase